MADVENIGNKLEKCRIKLAGYAYSIANGIGPGVKVDELRAVRYVLLGVIPKLISEVEVSPELKHDAEQNKLAACQALDWAVLNGLTELIPELEAIKLAACQVLEWVCMILES